MNITISHPEFKTQLLELRVTGLFFRPSLWLNGFPVRGSKGVISEAYCVFNDAGQETAVVVNRHVLYRLPQVLIELDEVKLAGKAGWTQYEGWKKSMPTLWIVALLKWMVALIQIKKLNKST